MIFVCYCCSSGYYSCSCSCVSFWLTYVHQILLDSTVIVAVFVIIVVFAVVIVVVYVVVVILIIVALHNVFSCG